MPALDIVDIQNSLPHRYPMLMVDRVLECDGEKHIVSIKNVTVNEPCFQGHFPGMPIMPGVLQLEAMAQTAGLLLNQIANGNGKIPYIMGIDKAKFRRLVRPGDQMRIEVNVMRLRSNTVKFKSAVSVDGEVVSEAEMLCMLTEQKAGA